MEEKKSIGLGLSVLEVVTKLGMFMGNMVGFSSSSTLRASNLLLVEILGIVM